MAKPHRINVKKSNRFKLRLFKETNKCRYCPEILTLKTATLDHLVPLSKGGTNDFYNFALACYRCNHIKADKCLQ
jgi:5-methylcytosine-specific restriction endonuclease McrA